MAMAIADSETEIEPRGRLSAPRMLRVWHMTEDIAAHPGRGRKQMAAQYALSERQTQADLNLIKRQIGLPLVLHGGYRFAADGDNGVLTLADIELLLLVLDRALSDPPAGVPQARIRSLLAVLPSVVSPVLRPLVEASLSNDGRQVPVFARLAHALVARSWVRLDYADDKAPFHDPTIRPEVILPYEGEWYVIGECRQRGRLTILPLEHVVAVTEAEPRTLA